MHNPDLDVMQSFRGRCRTLWLAARRSEPGAAGGLVLFYCKANFAVNSLYFARAEIAQ
jgi:hypothetical protein